MNKKVLVTVRGLQHEYRNCPDTEIQTIQQGIYKHIQDKHIITYEELSGGFPDSRADENGYSIQGRN